MGISSGTKLGSFDVLERIGGGGMGEVFRARDTRLDRLVAIKVLNRELGTATDFKLRFEREARVISQLNHPNICTLYDLGREDGIDFLVMELLEGESLAERLSRGALQTRELLAIALEITGALDSAHRANIIHRDIKPANVFLGSHGHVKLLDFGLAKIVHTAAAGAGDNSTTTLSEIGVLAGTPAYMSPEQVSGEQLDERTDLFSFGVILYEMATGTRPFHGNTSGELFASILHREPVPAVRVNPRVPPALEQIIAKALEKGRDLRYQSAVEIKADLQRLRRDLDSGRTSLYENGDAKALEQSAALDETVLCKFALTESLCRKLDRSTLDPRIIGDHLQFLDNQVSSDVLVLFVPGLGLDCRDFEPMLKALPYRAFSQTLYGSERERRNRISLGLSDHIVILREWIRDAVRRCQPKTVVLVAFALGADMALELLARESGETLPKIDGFLSLECNLSADTCFISQLIAALDLNRPETWITDLKRCGEAAASLDEWLTGYEYLIRVLRKFQSDIGLLQKTTADLVGPLMKEPGFAVFARRFRAARRRVPSVRLVFSDASANRGTLAKLKLENLDNRILDEDFPDEDVIVSPNTNHFFLTASTESIHLVNGFITKVRK